MAKESVLTVADKEAIRIEKLIFHIILTDSVNPIFLETIEITPEQQKFFMDRLADVSQGRHYIFSADNPPIKDLATRILDASEDEFVRISKDITSRFKTAHNQSTNNGVFIVSVASIRNRKLLFLIKLDHKKVYEYKVKGNKALLEEVKNTFSEDKTAIQKVALIDVSPSVVWDVLVYDRSCPSKITKFFGNFLSVLPRETERDLTTKTLTSARKWASLNRSENIGEPSVYKTRAKNYLMSVDEFNSDKFIEAVVQDNDLEKQSILRDSLKSYLIDNGLYGQIFEPKKDALNKRESKNIRQTAEGVKIEWEGAPEDNNITISNNKDQRGQYTITIRTSEIKEIQ